MTFFSGSNLALDCPTENCLSRPALSIALLSTLLLPLGPEAGNEEEVDLSGIKHTEKDEYGNCM